MFAMFRRYGLRRLSGLFVGIFVDQRRGDDAYRVDSFGDCALVRLAAGAPTEWVLKQLSDFEPVVSEINPNEFDVDLQSLPEFEPVLGEPDPNDLDVSPQNLLEFEPNVSEIDPNDSNVGLQVLPEFDPNVND